MLEPSPLLSALVNWLLTYAIHSTIFVCAVWLLVTAARWMSDSTREALWKLALIGPLVTSAIQLGSGLEPALGAFEVDTGAAAAAPARAPVPAADGPVVRRHTVVTDAGSYTFVVERDPASAAAESVPVDAGSPPVWPWVLVGLWGFGAALALARVGAGVLRLRRQLRGRQQVIEDPVLESFLALCQKAQIGRKVRLTAAPGLETPVALWRSEICLPTRALIELAPRQIHAVLAHELAHLQRRDPMWMTAIAIIEAMFFFQPLNRLARRRLQETAEYLCDDWAVRHTGSGEYLATSLARVASWQGECVATPLAPGVMRPGRPFVRRVNRLLDASRDRKASDGGPARVGLVLGLMAATVALAPGVVEARVDATTLPMPARADLEVAQVDPPRAPEPPAAEEDPEVEDQDEVAIVVVPDDCCGHRHGHGHGFGWFGGSAIQLWGSVGDSDLDFDFDVRVVVPDVHVDLGSPHAHDHHARALGRHAREVERLHRHHARNRERALDRLERELEREHDRAFEERLEDELVEHLILDVLDW